MKKLDLLYEGKAKKVFRTDDEDVLIVDYKDDATAWTVTCIPSRPPIHTKAKGPAGTVPARPLYPHHYCLVL